MTEYIVEKGVPMKKVVSKGDKNWNLMPYDTIEIGESFFIDNTTTTKISSIQNNWKKKSGKNFKSRKENNGVRVTRLI